MEGIEIWGRVAGTSGGVKRLKLAARQRRSGVR